MRKIISNLCSIVFLLIATNALAQEDKKKRYEFEKRKVYEKSYSISTSDKVKISNQFGAVTINTWEKNEVKVNVEIMVSAKTEEWADNVLGSIDVSDKKEGGLVSFKTSIDNIHKGKKYNTNSNQSMEINYTVYLPAGNPLEIKNEFGPTVIPDYNGEVNLVSKFGSLTAGKLANVDEILVEFGKAKIKSLTGANAVFKFSKIELDNLKGENVLKFEFCNASKLLLDNDITALDLQESYSRLNIKPSEDFSATYNIKTSFGTLRNRTKLALNRTDKEPEYGADMEKSFEAKSGSGAIKVKIKSSFGTIIIGEATAEEMKDKKEKGGSKDSEKEVVDL